MNLKTDFTKPELDYYRQNCNFTPQELEIFNLRAKDKSLVEISFAMDMSVATVSRRLKNIKKKIERT